MPRVRRSGAACIGAAALLLALTWYATTLARYPSGFTARYYHGRAWAGTPAVTTIDPDVTTAAIRRAWTLGGEPFSVRWDAFLVIARSTTSRFSVLADGTARLFVDNRQIVDSGSLPGRRRVTSEIRLNRGVHTVRIEYAPADISEPPNISGAAPVSPLQIEVAWASSPLHRLTPLTGPVWSPRSPGAYQAFVRGCIDVARTWIAFLSESVYLLLVSLVVARALKRLIRHHAPDGLPAPVKALVVATAGLYAVGITWGVPGPGWAPDELLPIDLFAGVDRFFSHGWWSKYPPVHFYLCSVLSIPFLVWRWLDPVAFAASLAPDALVIVFRGVSVAMAVAAVMIVYLCGRYLYSEWPSFVAAALAALTMPALYYGKIANLDVPYVFWFSLSLVSFARLAADGSAADYVLFAVAAALAVCTKDQAYGLYALPATALLTKGQPKRLLLGAAAGAVAFAVADNLLFNWTGFIAHVKYITSPGAQPFRMFPPTPAGQWRLWKANVLLARVSWGWPAFMLCVAGLAVSIWRRGPSQRRLWWLLLPAISYYATFIAVVGYTYDRFLLPIFVMLALAGGFCVSQVEAIAPARQWLRYAVATTIGYSVAYVAAVNVALLRDSRYEVEAWLRTHVESDATIGVVGVVEHSPRIERWFTEFVDPTVPNLQLSGFEYLVVNTDWAARFGPERLQHEGLRQLETERLKYHRVFGAHTPASFAGMPLSPRFEAFGSSGYSTLTKLNPPIVVYKR